MDDKITSLADWRKTRKHELILPSGLPVVVRDVDMTDILMSGKLPPSVLDMAKKASEMDDEVDVESIGVEVLQSSAEDFAKLLDAITKAALVSPEIGDVEDDTHITLDELPMTDKAEIMAWVNRGGAAVQSFRPEEGKPVAAV